MKNIIDGRRVAREIEQGLKEKIGRLTHPPGLAFVLVGKNPSSHTYVKMKRKKCLELGIASKDREFPETTSEQELLLHIATLNSDSSVDGILIQLPLPSHIRPYKVMEAISPEKDVDGFHPMNLGKVLLGQGELFFPCTPLGIQRLLSAYQISTHGKRVVILGRSSIVGKPMAAMLMQKKPDCNATVTMAHLATPNLSEITRSADILIVAIGDPRFVKKSMVKEGVVVIDVGMTRVGGKLIGDVDFEEVAPLASWITPVPGGVGPMTVAMLMSNTLHSYESRRVQ